MASVLGPYTLGEQIGEVTLGPIVAASRGDDTAPLALALVRDELRASSRFGGLLRLEVARAQSVGAAGLARLVEVVERDGQLAVVLERPTGERLDVWRARLGQATPAAVGDILVRIANALGEAHRRGVVHGELAPDQVWVGPDGGVSVVGVGLLAPVEQAEGDTTAGRSDWLGCVAPEVVGASRATPSADGYALGALAYWLLTGQEPFGPEATPPPPYAQCELEPPSLRALRPDLSVEAEAVFGRQLGRQPGARYPTLAAFAAELRAVLA